MRVPLPSIKFVYLNILLLIVTNGGFEEQINKNNSNKGQISEIEKFLLGITK